MKARKVRQSCLPFALSILMSATFSAHAESADDAATLIAKGKYLAIAADCGACHTAPNQGREMSGGYIISSPLGNIVASNITPSKTAGIGNYTEQDFAKAVRSGINKQGQHLYPAMPYTSYAKISDADIHALYAYFMHGVKADDNVPPKTDLPFPFNIRSSMFFWNMLFADDKPFIPAQDKSVQVNRGDYLVNALAHCDTCHTPRNALMGQNNDRALSGGSLGSWYAPNITPDNQAGIGNWSDAEIAQYLKTGHVAGKAQAAGPMAEAVEHSLQHLSDDDINAMVAYLRQVPAVGQPTRQPRDRMGKPASDEMAQRALNHPDAGWQVYASSCANCHQADGAGNQFYPSLFHNTATGAPQADNLIATIVYGVHRQVNGKDVAMPGFGPDGLFTDRLTDRQIADVSNYVLKNFGNAELNVTPDQVKTLREGGERPLIARLAQPAVWGGGAIVVIILLVLLFAITRRGKKHGA
ncbi:cytochrome c [Pantoea sp. BIGb0393]|uniref:Cytochrome c n=1 Tax=Pantoea nemavictus TaxID=2726955 RepID=A0ABU8PY61_9GAMM|nr:cytochrome c [Pantoea nemavictus]MBA0038586.1 cytochrome c [Pantoea nemavictus]